MSTGSCYSILKNDGTIWSAGYNIYGQLGLGDTTNRTTFTKVNIDNVKSTSYGYYHTLILKNDGTIWGCGYNSNGQLGLGDTTNRTTFTKVNITDIKTISCGSAFSIVLKNDGTLWSAGRNYDGQLGLGDTADRSTFTKLNIDNVKSISCGSFYAFLLKNDGTVWSTGKNNYGQLGFGDNTDRSTFTKVDIDNVKSISCGIASTIILKNDGTVWSCGSNAYGQFGFGDTANRSTFTKVDIDNVKSVISGENHTLILKNDGTLWSCGKNDYGQLGLGDTSNKNIFTKVNITDIKTISCGGSHTFILKNDGTIWSAGYNIYGQLGLGDTTNRTTFTKVNIDNVKELLSDVVIEEILKYIIKSIKGNYTISDNLLTSITEDITNINIAILGSSLEDINTNLSLLPDEFSLITNKENPITINGLQDTSQMMVASSDFSTKIQDNIDYFKGEYTKSESSQIKIVFSIDGGITWKTHDGIEFKDLTIGIPSKEYNTLSVTELEKWNTAKENILVNGIDISILNTIDFNTLEFDKIRFAYVTGVENSSDVAINKNLVWQFDSKGNMKQLKDTEFNLELSYNGVVFSPLINSDMIKVNILPNGIRVVSDFKFANNDEIDILFKQGVENE